MSNDGLYEVTDFVSDILAEDHNSLVSVVRESNASFGGNFNYGDGRDGHLKLGVISESAPTPTVSPEGSGNVTGNFYYKVSIYNLSGETTPSAASSVANPVNQNVRIDIPALASSTNITGFYIYRSNDDITYNRIGVLPVDDPEIANFFIDEIPSLTSYLSPNPQGSNTTSDNANLSLPSSINKTIFFCKTLTVNSNQTITSNSYAPLIFICSGQVNITGNGVSYSLSSQYNVGYILRRQSYNSASFMIDPPTSSTTLIPNSSNGIFTSDAFVDGVLGGQRSTSIFYQTYPTIQNFNNLILNLGKQGCGGIQSGTPVNYIGGDIVILANSNINISNAILNARAFNGILSNKQAGNAGGNIILKSEEYISISDSTLLANGSDGGSPLTTNMIGHGGGGGGLIYLDSPVISENNVTYNVSGGLAGTNNGSGTVIGASGGSNIGRGGYNSATAFSGLSRNGEDGAVVKITNNSINFRF